MLRDRYEQELFKRPVVKSTAQGTTQPTSQPAQVLDVQLQRAVDTMIALVVLNQNQLAAAPTMVVPPVVQKTATTAPVNLPTIAPVAAPTTAPTTKP